VNGAATSRRAFLRSLAGASAVAAGCRPSQRDYAGKVEISFYHYASPEYLRLYNDHLIPAFESAHPDIKVRMITSLGDAGYDTKLLTLILSDLSPDVFHILHQNFGFYAARDLLLPIDDLARDDSSFNFDSIDTNVLNLMRVDGKTLGLPADFSTIIMFYNQDLFDRFGVEYPKPGWNWDDFLNKCRALTHDTNSDGYNDIYGTVNPGNYNRWPPWVWMNGGDVFTPDRTRCVLDSPPDAVGGLQFYADLSVRHHVAPMMAQPPDAENVRLQSLFATGVVGMMAESRYRYKRFLAGKGLPFRWDVAPMPRGKTQATTFIWGGNSILRGTRHPRQAWELAKFLAGSAGAMMNWIGGNALPAHRISAEREIAQPHQPNTPANDRYFLDAIGHGRIAQFPPQYPEFMEALNDVYDVFIPSRNKSVEQVCYAFARRVNKAMQSEVS
jgi:multiple sugar transport system substrate-binding protein